MEFEKQFTKITMKNAVIFLQDLHVYANLCCDGDIILLDLRFVRLCKFRIILYIRYDGVMVCC